MEDAFEKRNRIIGKARQMIETGTSEPLTMQEEQELQEFGGVVFIAYQKAVDCINNNQKGGKKDEREL